MYAQRAQQCTVCFQSWRFQLNQMGGGESIAVQICDQLEDLTLLPMQNVFKQDIIFLVDKIIAGLTHSEILMSIKNWSMLLVKNKYLMQFGVM